jgi:8-hydroxy-5-deazaflavin:NADPH oxidoreductase
VPTRPTIAIIGGTGDLGSGLAKRWLAAGYPVVLGSRSKDKAEAAARAMAGGDDAATIRGDDNAAAARAADVVVIAVPYANHDAMLNEIKPAVDGKVVVDAVVPLVPPRVSVVSLPPEGSAAQVAQRMLASARVASGFHNVSAAKLHAGGDLDCDVLVFGDDRDAREMVIRLANAVGTRGVDGGALANSAAAEALTSILIGINRRYKVEGAGIRITGLPPAAPANTSR